MNRFNEGAWIVLFVVLTTAMAEAVRGAAPPVPAFPGAEGAGMYTVGGRGGRVIEVTNLDDAGSGSLRAAVEALGPRTVVFRTGGTIRLKSTLSIRNPDITIAGQTAPGGGICLRDCPLDIRAEQAIVRFLRVRPGDTLGVAMDAIGSRYQRDIVIDHCSASWSIDECVSMYRAENLTVQWCIIAESLTGSAHEKGDHGYGGIWGGWPATFHHNLLAHHTSRNPRFATTERREPVQRIDHRNNVIYNWGYNSCYGGERGVEINLMNNYYKPGPGTSEGSRARIAQTGHAPSEMIERRLLGSEVGPNAANEGLWLSRWHIAGNVMVDSPEVTADNWKGVTTEKAERGIEPLDYRAEKPFEFLPVTTESAEVAYDRVLRHAGAFLPQRDALDERYIRETRAGTAEFAAHAGPGFIDSQESVGDWPDLAAGTPPADADHDGMPDAWETQHGLNPTNPTDGPVDDDFDGYTNLEEYLNGTDPGEFVDYTNPDCNRFSWD
jgi:pectate lyase